MKTFAELQEEISARRVAELKAKGKGDAVKAQMKSDNTKVAPHQGSKEKLKRLPEPGGQLAHRPADKGREIVKQKSSAITPSKSSALVAPKPEKGGALVANGRKPDRAPNTYRYGQAPDKPKDKKPGPDLGKMAKGAGKAAMGLAGKVGKGIMGAKTTQKGQPMSRGGGINAPKRGVYNG